MGRTLVRQMVTKEGRCYPLCTTPIDCGEPRPPTAIRSLRENEFTRTVLGDHSTVRLAQLGLGCPGSVDVTD